MCSSNGAGSRQNMEGRRMGCATGGNSGTNEIFIWTVSTRNSSLAPFLIPYSKYGTLDSRSS